MSKFESRRAAGASHDEDGVPVTGGGQQTGTGAPRRSTSRLVPTVVPRLKRSVDGDQIGNGGTALLGEYGEGVEHAHGEVVTWSWPLWRSTGGHGLVHRCTVGEGAPSVDAYVNTPQAACFHPRRVPS